MQIITGNLLGDGYLLLNYKINPLKSNNFRNAKFGMTQDIYSLDYLQNLYDSVYKQFSSSGLNPYPNTFLPQHKGKTVTHYSFKTKSLPLFNCLHNMWYENKNKYIKIVPLNISEMFCFQKYL